MKYGIIELHDLYDFNAPNAHREVVMCGECKKLRDCRGDDWERDVIESGYIGWCNRTSKFGEADYVKADDFCSYGERRE